MALPEGNKAVGHTFGFEFDGVQIKSITEVTGLKLEQEVIDLKQNGPDGKPDNRRLPGPNKTPDKITLTRGVSEENSFEKWIKDSRFGKMENARKGGAFILYDYEGNPIKRWILTNAWPVSLELGTLKAGDQAWLTEKLGIVCESIEVE